MLNFILLILLVYICIMTTLYILLESSVFKKKKQQPMILPQTPLNFENDIKFLNFIIEKKIDLLNRYILIPKKFTDSTIAKEEDVEKYKLQISFEVFETLSNQYKMQLYKYFSEVELKTYISETVMDNLNSIILKGVIKK